MEYANRIIDYLDGHELRLAVVLREQRDRLQTEDAGGRREAVLARQVLVVHGATDPVAAGPALRRLAESIARQVTEVDSQLLWETVRERGAVLTLGGLAEEYYGKASEVQRSAVARCVLADTVRFRRKGLEFVARSADEVEQQVEQQRRRRERAAAREQATAWLRDVLAEGVAPPAEPPADVLGWVEGFILGGHNNEAAKLLAEAQPRLDAREAGIEILRRLGRLPAGADPFLLAKGVFAEFAESVTRYAGQVSPYVLQASRPDWTCLEAFSIDDEDTREIDDALAVEETADGTVVTVHIADPSVFVHRGDPVDRAAFERTLTLYLPTTVVTMLPERIGCDLASLNRDALRPALSVRAVFGPDGALRDSSIARTTLRVRHRLTYAEADAHLAGPGDGAVATALRRLAALTAGLRAGREARGAVRLCRPEVKVKVRDGRITVTLIDDRSPSRALVAETMVLANRLCAEHALRHDVPVIYRVQDPPDEAVPPMAAYDPLLFDRLVRRVKRTRFSTHPQAHAGLGLDVYTQISSPIRRYADLVLQRQLAAALAGEAPPYTVTELVEVLSAAENTEKQNRQMESEARTYWILEYLRRDHLTDELAGTVVTDARGNRLLELDGLLVRGRLASTGGKPGERLVARIASINPSQGQLLLEA